MKSTIRLAGFVGRGFGAGRHRTGRDDGGAGRGDLQVERARRLDSAAQCQGRAGRVPQARAGPLRREAGPLAPPVRRARAGGIRRALPRSRRGVPTRGARPLEDLRRRASLHDVQPPRSRIQHAGGDDGGGGDRAPAHQGARGAQRGRARNGLLQPAAGHLLQGAREHHRRPEGAEHPRLQPRAAALLRAARRPPADHSPGATLLPRCCKVWSTAPSPAPAPASRSASAIPPST